MFNFICRQLIFQKRIDDFDIAVVCTIPYDDIIFCGVNFIHINQLFSDIKCIFIDHSAMRCHFRNPCQNAIVIQMEYIQFLNRKFICVTVCIFSSIYHCPCIRFIFIFCQIETCPIIIIFFACTKHRLLHDLITAMINNHYFTSNLLSLFHGFKIHNYIISPGSANEPGLII